MTAASQLKAHVLRGDGAAAASSVEHAAAFRVSHTRHMMRSVRRITCCGSAGRRARDGPRAGCGGWPCGPAAPAAAPAHVVPRAPPGTRRSVPTAHQTLSDHTRRDKGSTREMTEFRRDQLVSYEKPCIFTDNDPIATSGCALNSSQYFANASANFAQNGTRCPNLQSKG